MKKWLQNWVLLTLVVFGTSGCYNAVEQQLYQGNYDEVLQSSLAKIIKSKKRDEYIDIAVKAYKKVNAEDQDQINTLKAQNSDGTKWGKIYYIYRKMLDRQNSIVPYLPFTYTDGRTVAVETYNLLPVLEEARTNAADHHYERASQYLSDSTRLGGRKAFDELKEALHYIHDYKDSEILINHAIALGTNKVLLKIHPSYQLQLPPTFLEELGYYDYEGKLHSWCELYRNAEDESDFDFVVEVEINRVTLTPQHVKELRYREEETVEDGHQPLLDEEGNYVTDTSGNIIQIPKYETLVCYVTEWTQHRTITLESSFEIHDLRKNQRVMHQDLVDQAVFEHTYATANGNIDILPREVIRKLNVQPQPFPSDWEMINLTKESLKRQIGTTLNKNNRLLNSI